MDTLSDLAGGFAAAVQPASLAFALLGVLLGTVVGVLILGSPTKGSDLKDLSASSDMGQLEPTADQSTTTTEDVFALFGARRGRDVEVLR